MPTNRISPDEFATLPHGQKQRVLAQLPSKYGGWLLDEKYGHEYDPFIYGLIPDYCTWSFLEAGGESEHIVKAGEVGRRTGMGMVAGDPFNNYTSGSPLVIQAEILFSTKTLHRGVIRYGWQENQRQELRYPSVSLDDLVQTPDGEYVSLHELVADPTEVGDPVGDMLEIEALQGALRKLTPDTRRMAVERLLFGEDVATIALERDQGEETVGRRLRRAMNIIHEELRAEEISGFDREAAIAQRYMRLLQKIL